MDPNVAERILRRTRNLPDAIVEGLLYLKNIRTSKSVIMKGSLFEDLLDLRHGTIGGSLDLRSITVQGNLNLYDLHVRGDLDLENAVIQGDLDLNTVCIQGQLKLKGLTVRGNLYMDDVQIRGGIDIEGILVEGHGPSLIFIPDDDEPEEAIDLSGIYADSNKV